MSGVVGLTKSAGKEFRTTNELQIQKSTGRSIVLATNTIIHDRNTIAQQQQHPTQNGDTINSTVQKTSGITTSDLSESRYWLESFGLAGGSSSQTASHKRNKVHAHARAVDIQAASASIIHELHFHVSSNSNSNNNIPPTNNTFLAVVAGPRVQLYGTTVDSTFHRTLYSHTTTLDTTLPQNNSISADRQVPTGGQLAICSSFRGDGRLVAVGTDKGVVRIADCTSRATLCQFTCYGAQMPIRSVTWFRNGQNILAAGDDAVLRIWQLKQQQNQSSAYGFGTNINNHHQSGAVLECKGHGDAIRCAILWQLPVSVEKKKRTYPFPYKALAATGSYDHTIRLWDMEGLDSDDNTTTTATENTAAKSGTRCVSILQHGAPVEVVQWMASSLDLNYTNANSDSSIPPIWLISVGGTTVKVWNPMNGVCVSTIQTQHRKTITCLLAMPRIYRSSPTSPKQYKMRLLTGGLDGLIRVHTFDRDTGRIQHLHGIRINKYNEGGAGDGSKNKKNSVLGITALATSPAADRIAIGTTAGTVLVRQKGSSKVDAEAKKRKGEPRAGTYAFFTRGSNADPIAGDQIVLDGRMSGKKRKLSKFDIALKQFRHGDALDEALESRQPNAIIAVLEELGKRRGLTQALSNRDEESLEPILSFLIRYISKPRYSEILIGVAHKLIDLYKTKTNNSSFIKISTSQSDIIDELFNKLRMQLRGECRIQKSLFRLVGQLDAIMTTAAAAAQMDDEE